MNAGYISEKDIHPVSQLKGLDDLNENELNIVQLFIDFIKTKRDDDAHKEGWL